LQLAQRTEPKSSGDSSVPSAAVDLSTRRLATGTRDTLLGLIGERVFGVVLFLALPFLLSPRDLGTYYEVITLLVIAATMATVGLDVGLVRYTALAIESGDMAAVRSHVRVVSRIALGSSMVLALGLWLFSPRLAQLFHAANLGPVLRLGAISLPPLVSTSLLVAPAKGLKLMWPSVLVTQLAQPAIQLVVTVSLVLAGLGLAGAVGGFAAAAVVAWLLALTLMIRLDLPAPIAGRGTETWPLVRFSAPVSGMILAGTMLLWVDTLLLGALRTPAEVATYGIVVRLLSIASAALVAVIQIFGPFVTQLVARRDLRRLEEILQTATRWTFMAAVPALLSFMILGQPLLAFFRQPPGEGSRAILILASAFLIDAGTGPLGHILTMSGRSSLNLANNVAALVFNVALNLILIPRLGLVGAAWAWGIVIVLLGVARIAEVWLLFRIDPFGRSLWKPAIAALPAAAGSMLTLHELRAMTASPPLVLIAVAGGVFFGLYGGIVWLLRLEAEDRFLLRTVMRLRRGGESPA
jgi:O-antigen/teichoic acid export membrane protein